MINSCEEAAQNGAAEGADDDAACAWARRADIEAGKYPTFPILLPLFDLALALQG